MTRGLRAAVFLDRDDTLIACNGLPRSSRAGAAVGDLCEPELVRLLPGVAEGLSALTAAGFALVVVTNQGAVARGAITLEEVERVNDRLRVVLAERGVRLDGVYYCPFHADPHHAGRMGSGVAGGGVARFVRGGGEDGGRHAWQKPRGGMIEAAAAELGLDLSRSWLIGDAARDVEAGIDAGIAAERCLRVGEKSGFTEVCCEIFTV